MGRRARISLGFLAEPTAAVPAISSGVTDWQIATPSDDLLDQHLGIPGMQLNMVGRWPMPFYAACGRDCWPSLAS